MCHAAKLHLAIFVLQHLSFADNQQNGATAGRTSIAVCLSVKCFQWIVLEWTARIYNEIMSYDFICKAII